MDVRIFYSQIFIPIFFKIIFITVFPDFNEINCQITDATSKLFMIFLFMILLMSNVHNMEYHRNTCFSN